MTSPVCTAWRQINNINDSRMRPGEKEDILARARVHLEFVCRIHRRQHRAARFFVHEPPAWASSWYEPCVQDVLRETRATVTRIDQCMYGLKTTNTKGEEMAAKKPTKLMSNMQTIDLFVNEICNKCHKHAPLEGGGRCRKA